jgi:hypothetical protein
MPRRRSFRRPGPGLAARLAVVGATLLLAACTVPELPEDSTPPAAPVAAEPAQPNAPADAPEPVDEAPAPMEEPPAAAEPAAAALQTAAEARLLAPGEFQSPLVRLKRLQGENGHLHVDEVRYRASDGRLFQCSYTFGVVDATNPAQMDYLAQNLRHTIPDDERTPGCIHLAYDGDIVYTTHRGNIRNPAFLTTWDVSQVDPEDDEAIIPVQGPVLQEPGVRYEGVDVGEDGVVFVAISEDGLGVYRRDPETSEIERMGELGDIGSTWGLRVQGDTAYLTDLDGNLVVVDVADPESPQLLGTVETGGVARGLAVEGDYAYVAAGSVGLVVVDVSDPAKPEVVSTTDTPGTAIRVNVSDGHAFVADWNDARVYDVSNPAEPAFVGAVRLTTDVVYPDDDGRPPVTARTLGIAADGNNVFVGNWWVLYSYRLYPDRVAPSVLLPEDVSLVDLGPVEEGEEQTVRIPVANQGTAPLTLFHNWTTNEAFTVSPRQVRIEPGDEAELTVSYAGTGTERDTSLLNIWTDDPGQPVRSAFLVANQPGLGMGKELPETRAVLLDGTEWSSSQAEGDVLLLAYFATF